MATTYTLTGKAADLVGDAFAASELTGYVEASQDVVNESDVNRQRYGREPLSFGADGSWSVSLVGTGTLVHAYRVTIRARDRQLGVKTVVSAWFALTANTQFGSVVQVETVAAQTAAESATAAVAAANAAQIAANQASLIAGLTGEDDAVAALIQDEGSDTRAALAASFVPRDEWEGGGSGVASLPQFHGVPYTAYGHSFGGTTVGNAWPGSVYAARLRDLLHADPTQYANRCSDGNTLPQIAATAAATWDDGRGGLVTLMGNQNSVGTTHNDPDAETVYKTALRSFLDTMTGTTGYPPTVLLIKDVTCTSVGYARYAAPYATDADVATFNGWLVDVAEEYAAGWLLVADPMAAGYDPDTMTCDDGQHPNDLGMATIARACLTALATSGFRLGLNKGITDTEPTDPIDPPDPGDPDFLEGATVGDNFNRGDGPLGATSLGAVAWEVLAGTWAVSANKAAVSSGADAFAVVQTGNANGAVKVQVGVGTGNIGESGPAFRTTDANNTWILYGGDAPGADTKWTLAKKSGGNYSFLARTANVTPAAGDVIVIELAGNSIVAKVNGVTVATATDSFNATATKHGMRGSTVTTAPLDTWSFAP